MQYVIVGGVAAIHHGATRLTDDLDICGAGHRKTSICLAQVLSELRAELAISERETVPVPLIDGVLIRRMEIGTWQTSVGRFDILRGIPQTATQLADYEQLAPHAHTVRIGNHTASIADLHAVIRSKQLAGRPKDQDALPELEALASQLLAAAGCGHSPQRATPRAEREDRPSTRQRNAGLGAAVE